MTAPTYDTLTSDDTGADKILTTGTVTALDQNQVSIAQRGTSAPVPQVPVVEKLTAASGNWTWPNGVTAATFWIQAAGGGGSGDSADGGDGGDSSITYNSVTTTAKGGGGGEDAGAGGLGGNGGGGDIYVSGRNTRTWYGADSFFGTGGVPGSSRSPNQGGGGGGSRGGGGGEMVRKRVVRVDGLNTVAYVNGTAGTAGAGAGYPQAGAAGLIVVEY